MPDRRPRRLAGLTLAAATLALAAPAPAAPPARRNWNAAVSVTQQGTHVLGNPAARIRLTEFISYTCSHCAEFEREADGPLRLAFVAGGQGAIEVRHFIRDPVDLTVALLTNCGPPAKFFLNHAAFLRSQAKWIVPLGNPSAAQRARWAGGSFVQRTRAIARDFGFYPIMRTRGYIPAQVDACLADEGLAKRLAAATAQAQEDFGVTGTPSFAIDGVVLTGTHTWAALRPQLEARLRPN